MRLFCGIDSGTRSSALCVIGEDKEVKFRWRGKNSEVRQTLEQFGSNLNCVVEAGPLSEWLCQQVELAGARIEVVDSRHTKAILMGKKKTDKIDAQVLAELALSGWYKPIYRKSKEAREQKTIVNGRATVVKVSVELKNTIRGLLKGFGIVVPLGEEGREFETSIRTAITPLNKDVKRTIIDLLNLWKAAYSMQRQAYKDLMSIAKRDETTKRLMTVPGVGPATAITFSSTLDDIGRFPDGKHVVGYLGLAPKVHQSGDTEYHGRITKCGDSLTRSLLVEAANTLLTRVKKSTPLKEWGLKLAERKGLPKARVAVARRMALVLYGVWKSGNDFTVQVAA